MNGISMDMKRACVASHVAGTAAFAISIFDFFDAEPFGSAFFIQSHPGAKGDRIH